MYGIAFKQKLPPLSESLQIYSFLEIDMLR